MATGSTLEITKKITSPITSQILISALRGGGGGGGFRDKVMPQDEAHQS